MISTIGCMHKEFGWLGWAKNGESAGTAGYSYRLEAIEVKMVEKGGKAPGSIERPYVQRYSKLSDTCSRYWMARNKI